MPGFYCGGGPTSLIRNVNDGAAAVGRTMSLVSMIGSVIVGAVLISISIWLFTKPVDHAGRVDAKVVTVKSCKKELDGSPTGTKNKQSTYTSTCELVIEYVVNGIAYKEDYTISGSKFYSVGETIPIRYNVKNPKDFVQGKVSSKRIGAIITLVIGLAVIGGGVFTWYMSRKYKFYAAAQGYGEAYDIIS